MKLENGTVIVDPDKCIGCRACILACPYDARTHVSAATPYYGDKGFNAYEESIRDQHQSGTVEKCNFCKDRVEEGKEPACVQTCPTRTRIFGDLDDPNSEVSILIANNNGKQLHPQHGNEPSVYYLPHDYDDIDI